MRHARLLAGPTAMAAALLTYATVAGQAPASSSTFVAFRVDGSHMIASLKVGVHDTSTKQITEGLSAQPMAALGYQYFEPPAAWLQEGAAGMHAGDRWLIHAAPGKVFEATTERIVGGYAGCENAVGALLRVAPEQSDTFVKIPAKYFLAERVANPAQGQTQAQAQPKLRPTAANATDATVGVAPSPPTPEFRLAVTSVLNALLARELSRTIAAAAPELARNASSDAAYLRSWARQQQAVDKAMQDGRGVLTYDIQSFRLSPDGVPVHFVRAEWAVQGRQGFAASVWLRGGGPVDVIQSDLKPASWLRMSEFQGKVSREQVGLILNVFDRDHDGWGEVLLAQGGYEGMFISLLEYSPGGFQPTGVEFEGGC